MAQNVVGAQLPLVGMDGEEVCPTVLFHLSAVFHFKKVLPTEKKKKRILPRTHQKSRTSDERPLELQEASRAI